MTDGTMTSMEDSLERLGRVMAGEEDINQIQNIYADWASCYDQDLDIVGYQGPNMTAVTIAECFQTDRDTVRILDVAAGTGLVAEKLKEFGFCNIDAVDPCKTIIDIAMKKNLYEHVFREFMTEKPLDIKPDTYDAVTVTGGIEPGLIPCGALHEMIRVVKPGGIICILTRDAHFTNVEEYKNRLEPLMKKLEQDGKWKLTEKCYCPNYIAGMTGTKFLYTVC